MTCILWQESSPSSVRRAPSACHAHAGQHDLSKGSGRARTLSFTSARVLRQEMRRKMRRRSFSSRRNGSRINEALGCWLSDSKRSQRRRATRKTMKSTRTLLRQQLPKCWTRRRTWRRTCSTSCSGPRQDTTARRSWRRRLTTAKGRRRLCPVLFCRASKFGWSPRCDSVVEALREQQIEVSEESDKAFVDEARKLAQETRDVIMDRKG